MITQKIEHKQQLFEVSLEVAIIKEDEYYTAFCPALDLSSYGKSIVEAIDMFKDGIKIFIEDAIQKKNLNEQLLQLGWRLAKKPTINFEPPYIPLGMMRPYDVVKERKIRISLPV